ncbi:hypothetical protein HMPREF9141_1926 [Prevotella multiformis DSM 16608]|uniref:Uncharacterized protein n=1 Tax=Prevotella multiformis DSM 16608 TaxID=888743 RepID=F0F8K9_9BACT|nr:hypothetical protein HMPREF9141_1926 [Prevotella multiformis DSM 16608]
MSVSDSDCISEQYNGAKLLKKINIAAEQQGILLFIRLLCAIY